ncbi:hypothetical protein ACEN2D_05390 [Corynebacterium auriscanis]
MSEHTMTSARIRAWQPRTPPGQSGDAYRGHSTSPQPATGSMVTRGLALAAAATVTALVLTGCTIDKERFGGSSDSEQSAASHAESDPQEGRGGDRSSTRKPNPTQSAPRTTVGDSQPAPGAKQAGDLNAAIRHVQSKYAGQLGLAISDPRGNGSTAPVSYGSLDEGPAWSTAKIPVAIAVAKNGGVTPAMRSAITVSDNAAADSLWRSLGSPAQAGAAATMVLREGGDQVTTIHTAVTRPGFSSFGQTRWSLANQATFAANLQCIAGGSVVSDLMGQIAAGQNYGLGSIPGAHFKGGWGPDENGGYLTRQFGFIPGEKPGSFVGVAIAAKPADGTYETGQAMLTELARALTSLRGYGGTC